MSAILNVDLPDQSKVLVEATHPSIGDVQLHANQLYEGFGNGKAQSWATYLPQSSVGSVVENLQYDIIIPGSSSGMDIIDQLFLELTVSSNSVSNITQITYKPIFNWFQRVEISQEGGNIIQTIYSDQLFANYVTNTNTVNQDDIKAQVNTDPRNFLPWFDQEARAADITFDNVSVRNGANTAAIDVLIPSQNSGSSGRSSYLSQSYFRSVGDQSNNLAAVPPTVLAPGELANYQAFAKGGAFTVPVTNKKFYLPIWNTVLQQSKILLSEIKSSIRFRFYMNPQILMFDTGSGVNATVNTLSGANLWAFGQKLTPQTLAALSLKYQLPTISSFNYYLEFSQNFASVNLDDNSFTEVVLSPITGYCNQLLIYLQDDRPDIAYPGIASANGQTGDRKFIQNNQMTLPITNIQFVRDDGSIYGSGLPISGNLLQLANVFKSFPKSVSADDRLYFRKYYLIEFSKFPLNTAENAVYGGAYSMTGRERIRFAGDSTFAAALKELNGTGTDLVDVAPFKLYSNCSLHVVASIQAEAIMSSGLINTSIPRNLN